MKRNSTTIFLQSLGSITLIPWINNIPDFSGFEEPTLSILVNSWNDFLASGQKLEIIPDPEPLPIINNPDWEQLKNRLLAGDLYPLYNRIRLSSFVVNPTIENIIYANNVSTALGFITDGILTVKDENAVAVAINILLNQVGYQLTTEEITLWNNAVNECGFSNIMEIYDFSG